MPSDSTLFSCGGTLYQYKGEADDHPFYEPLGEIGDFNISIEKHKATSSAHAEYFIVVAEDEEVVFRQRIGVELQLNYSKEAASVHWQALIEDELEAVAFRFSAPPEQRARVSPQMCMDRFVAIYNECTYSLLTGYDEVNRDDEWYQYLGGAATYELRNEDAAEPVFEFDADKMAVAKTGAGNVCSADSLQFDRVLLLKKGTAESKIALQSMPVTERGFDKAGEERLEVGGVDGTATGTLLENGDTKMLVFGGKNSVVEEVDLATGTALGFRVTDRDIQSVAYANHTAAESGSVFTCLGRNVAFNIDTRMDPRSCVVMEAGKEPADYALGSLRKTFTCHATSRNGYLAIGDGNGAIRLYTGPPGARKPAGGYFPKSAKTLLETKTPIVDIDVTADGKYIVATTAQFLLFIETKYVDDKENETSGFQGRMGAKKPKPLVLQPSPTQTAQMGGPDAVRFRSAKFDRFPGAGELCVTASCQEYILTWSLHAIQNAQENGRAAVSSAMTVGQVVLSTSANRTEHVGFLTGDDVGVAPLLERQKPVSKTWTWGQKK